jgi:outer membrane lipoprotein carrier protein
MSRILSAFCALLLIITASQAATADKTRLNALVKEVQRVYGAMDAFQAAFTQTLSHQESNSFEVHDGELRFKKPLFVRWETARPQAELFLINSKEIWHYLPDEKLAWRYAPEFPQDSHMFIRVLTGQARLDQDFSVEEAGSEDGLLRLRLYPLEPSRQMVEVGLWIDPASYLIKKALILDFFGNSNEVAFTKLSARLKLDEKSFDFTPPRGVTVEDRRKGDMREQLFK